MAGAEDVVYPLVHAVVDIGKARSVAGGHVSVGESFADGVVDIGERGVVEVAAYDDGHVAMLLDVGGDGLCLSGAYLCRLDDFLEQFRQIKKMGSLDQLMAMMPGMNQAALKGASVDEKAVGRIEAIIYSMTPEERAKPELLNYSRKQRVAAGSGTKIQDVNRLLKQFEQTQKLMKQFSSSQKGRRGRPRFPF